MSSRMIYIHGNGTEHWSYGWAPWLKSELEKLGFSTFFETFPDSIIARAEYWLPFLKDHIKAGPDDILIGWSSGAVASMRYAETNKIRGSVLIAPCYTDLGDEHERQGGYYETPWNWEAIKNNQDKIALFCSDNDPYIPQEQFDFISEKLGAEMVKIPGAGHFTERSEFLEIMKWIKEQYL